MIDPRAVALQGIGFAAALVALQGLTPLQAEQQVQASPGYTATATLGQYLAAAAPAPYAPAQRLQRIATATDPSSAESTPQRPVTRPAGHSATVEQPAQRIAKAEPERSAGSKTGGRTASA